MVNVATELNTIATATYGSEMREAIHDSIDKNNKGINALSDGFGSDSLKRIFSSMNFYVTKNIMPLWKSQIKTLNENETLKYLDMRILEADGIILNPVNSTLSKRDVILSQGKDEDHPTVYLDVTPDFCYIPTKGYNMIRIWFGTSQDNIDDFEIYKIYDKNGFDIDDQNFDITDEFNIDEAKVDTPYWDDVFGDFMYSNYIKVAPGDEIFVESKYGIGRCNIRMYYPYMPPASSGGYPTMIPYSGETIPSTLISNRDSLKIPEMVGYVRIGFGEKDEIKIYRKRQKTEKSTYCMDFLGDSITFGFVTTSVQGNQYSYASWVNERLNFQKMNNYGVNATTVSPMQGRTNSFLERINTILKNEEYKPAYRNIFILGGINDWSNQIPIGNSNSPEINPDNIEISKVTFYKSYEALIKLCLDKYEGRVYAATPIPCANAEQTITYEQYVDAIVEICKKYSVPLLRLDSMSSLNPKITSVRSRYFSDTVHPNMWGQSNILAPIVSKFLENNMFSSITFF